MSTNNLHLESNELKVSGDESVSLKNNIDNLSDVRKRLENTIAESYRNGDNVLIEALPISGKSYSSIKLASETNTSILYLASLVETKKDARERCEEFELDWFEIPTPHNHCPSFQGKYGKKQVNSLEEKYKRGLSGKELHRSNNLPCGDSCPYLKKLDTDLSQYNVLIGNAKHGYNSDYSENRVVVKDEFSEKEYEKKYENAREMVNRFVRSVTIPVDSYDEILQERDKEKGAKALSWFQQWGIYRDMPNAKEFVEDYHVHAPALTFALLVGDGYQLNNGWEQVPFNTVDSWDIGRCDLSESAQCVRDSKTGNMYLLNPPEFEKADGFVGLDGTPDLNKWQVATGLNLEQRTILDNKEKKKYITDILNLNIIGLNDLANSYQNTTNISPPKDIKFAYSIWEKEGVKPGYISSKKNYKLHTDNDSDLYEYIDVRPDSDGTKLNFSRVLSSKKYEEKQVGFVNGSRNHGDLYLKKWGAYQGQTITVNDKRGKDRLYTVEETGETFQIYPYYRLQTLQDVFRFGRNEEPTTVYVNTSVLPDWVPTVDEELPTIRGSERTILEYLKQCEENAASQTELTEYTGLSKSYVSRLTSNLEELDLVERHEQGINQSPKYEWCGNQ